MTDKPKSIPKWKIEAQAELALIKGRLRREGELELLKKIDICGKPLTLKCTICRDSLLVEQRCKRRWCPSCARALAAQRSAELAYIVERMRRPLFVTLTMRNVSQITFADMRKLRRAFGKLRHRNLWRKNVVGGVAAIEITNQGNGWHPHLHAVVDCAWLAVKTSPPNRFHSQEEKKEIYRRAAVELHDIWAKLIGQETASIRIKRANRLTITKEVVKYTIKGSDLIGCEGLIGEMIRAIDGTRLMTTFGKAHGQCTRNVRADAKAKLIGDWKEAKKEMAPRCACGCEEFLPMDVAIRREEIEWCRMKPIDTIGRSMPRSFNRTE